jgi:hypothetical protein
LYLKSEKQIINVEILNLKGQLVKSLNSQNLEVSILISDIQKGLYFVKAMLSDGSVWNSKTVLK